jgi:hypothetical protein
MPFNLNKNAAQCIKMKLLRRSFSLLQLPRRAADTDSEHAKTATESMPAAEAKHVEASTKQRPRFLTTIDWRPYIEGAEDCIRDETLRCMLEFGIDNVRGWKYIDDALDEDQREEAFGLVCEKFALCTHCGKNGHAEPHCFETRFAASWCCAQRPRLVYK